MPRRNTPDDFWSRVQRGEPDECWPWIGPVTDRGYGKLSYGGKDRRAHQVAFFLEHGYYPPATLHHCDNPPCCNPDHLFAGINGSNNKDRAAKGRSWRPRGELHPLHKLTDAQIAEIRSLEGHCSHAVIASKFDIHRNYVGQILRGDRRA